MTKTIYIAADHAGYELKEEIVQYLLEKGEYDVEDLGTHSEEESVDYPDYGKAAGEEVVKNQGSFGIVVCGTGIGIGIAANKVPGAIAATVNNVQMAKLARQHNGANILALGGRDMPYLDEPFDIIDAFLNTDVDQGERHERRRKKLTES